MESRGEGSIYIGGRGRKGGGGRGKEMEEGGEGGGREVERGMQRRSVYYIIINLTILTIIIITKVTFT